MALEECERHVLALLPTNSLFGPSAATIGYLARIRRGDVLEALKSLERKGVVRSNGGHRWWQVKLLKT